MTDINTDPQGTAFTVSVDAHRRFGVTNRDQRPRPGQRPSRSSSTPHRPHEPPPSGAHLPPAGQARWRLRRVGQTEAAVDLAHLGGLEPAGVICEILNADGTMARRPHLEEIAREHALRFITVAQLVRIGSPRRASSAGSRRRTSPPSSAPSA